MSYQSPYRLTKQRSVILKKIKETCCHPTAEMLFEMVSKELPGINFSTVYRNLEFLEEKKLIIRLQTKDKKSRYDGNVTPHLHLICKQCGEIQDIHDCTDIQIHSKDLENSNFQIQTEFLEIPGICHQCSSQKN